MGDMVEKQIPFLPISGWMGDNLLKMEDSKGVKNMDWWSGCDVDASGEKLHVDTVYDFLDKVCRVPERPVSAPMRMPISGIYKIKGVGDVLAGRVEQGIVKPCRAKLACRLMVRKPLRDSLDRMGG